MVNTMSDIIRVSIAQTNILDFNKKQNLKKLTSIVHHLNGRSDMVVFPETFNTGFSRKSYDLYEPEQSTTYNLLKKLSTETQVAIVCSFLVSDDQGKIFNRFHFFSPDNNKVFYYDKRHLFSFGNEDKFLKQGENRCIIQFRGWNIFPSICYDIRFPVWCRNKNNEYDILINISNWPKSRQNALTTLLQARAIENSTYVIGVNRCGINTEGLIYEGKSAVINFKGDHIIQAENNEEQILTTDISLIELKSFRKKFPVNIDADDFELRI